MKRKGSEHTVLFYKLMFASDSLLIRKRSVLVLKVTYCYFFQGTFGWYRRICTSTEHIQFNEQTPGLRIIFTCVECPHVFNLSTFTPKLTHREIKKRSPFTPRAKNTNYYLRYYYVQKRYSHPPANLSSPATQQYAQQYCRASLGYQWSPFADSIGPHTKRKQTDKCSCSSSSQATFSTFRRSSVSRCQRQKIVSKLYDSLISAMNGERRTVDWPHQKKVPTKHPTFQGQPQLILTLLRQ